MTQGDPASPVIFNIVVDVVVRAVLEELCSPKESHHGMLGVEGERYFFLNADG